MRILLKKNKTMIVNGVAHTVNGEVDWPEDTETSVKILHQMLAAGVATEVKGPGRPPLGRGRVARSSSR